MWSLFKDGKVVEPLQYTSGKTQQDSINEILRALEKYDIVLFKGMVGSGKSVVALNVVNYFGSGNIVVPVKLLEQQYIDEYASGKYKIGNMNIHMMLGKSNYRCKYFGRSCFCGNKSCPCSKSLKEVKKAGGGKRKQKRIEVARGCPHWSPVYPSNISEKAVELLSKFNEQDYKMNEYEATNGPRTHILSPDPCEYYSDFTAYTDKSTKALVFNSSKWEIETWIGRKPKVPVEIIDEGDNFLDSLTYKINMSTNIFSQIKNKGLVPEGKMDLVISEFKEVLNKYTNYVGQIPDEIISFLSRFNEILAGESTDGTVCEMCNRINLMLKYTESTWVNMYKGHMTAFIPRPDITLNELMKKCGKLVLMSATFQEDYILRHIYGIKNYGVVEGETKFPGTLYLNKIGRETNINTQKWKDENFRKKYWFVLNKMVNNAKRPTLVQVHAKKYVPDDIELNVKNDNVWWSTVTDRGVDLPDDKCRSIVVLKYPFPDLSDPVLQTMNYTLGNKFWPYYRDMANRDLLQQVGRGLRNKDDWIELYSPDKRVFDEIEKLWNGKMVRRNLNMEIFR